MSAHASSDTIYALSSAQGRAGVAVFRVSGSNAKFAIERMAGVSPKARIATFAKLKNASGELIDEAVVLYFKGPASFTGEDVAEFQVHGGRAVIQALQETLSGYGCRLAEPGEFTRRAFENGKLDLTQAEGIADIIDAETQMQRVQALKQMGGALAIITQNWREKLLRILAHLEADIDFPDEDLPPHIVGQRIAQLTELNKEITAHLSDNRRGERLRDGFSIAVLGAPNAGKSSLINALAQRDAAIVSARAGTTRDIIEVHLDVAGYPIILADTAGLRDTNDEIEGEGIKRALQRAQDADLNIVLFDASTPPDAQSLALLSDKSFAVINKTDMAGSIPLPLREGLGEGYKNVLHISAKTGTGIAELLNAIAARLKDMLENQVAAPLTRARHREALTHCQQHLQRALDAYHGNKAPELVGEDIRLATRALARITGVVDVDDILDIIFREFCIGK